MIEISIKLTGSKTCPIKNPTKKECNRKTKFLLNYLIIKFRSRFGKLQDFSSEFVVWESSIIWRHLVATLSYSYLKLYRLLLRSKCVTKAM